MKFLLKTLCVLLALAGGSFASCFAAVLATKLAGGLKIDAWGMGEAYIFLFGAACGFAMALITLVVADLKDARFVILLGSVLAVPGAVVFALFLSVTFLGGTLPRLWREKRANALNCDSCPMMPLMASTAETPDDNLMDIAEHNCRYPSGVRYDKNSTDRALVQYTPNYFA